MDRSLIYVRQPGAKVHRLAFDIQDCERASYQLDFLAGTSCPTGFVSARGCAYLDSARDHMTFQVEGNEQLFLVVPSSRYRGTYHHDSFALSFVGGLPLKDLVGTDRSEY